MIQRYTIISEEVEDFVLEVLIDSDATFASLHQIILNTCGYDDLHNHAFLFFNEDYHIEQKILQRDNGKLRSDEDLNLMHASHLLDFAEDEGQRIAYVFDPINKRYLLMELTENIFGKNIDEPVLSRSHGTAPMQVLVEEPEISIPVSVAKAEDEAEEETESFYGDEGFADDELDSDGFGIDE